jgi:uncharacterized protein YaaN involved in tellurite resistance
MSVVANGQTISTLFCVIWTIKLLFPERRRFINELRIQIQDLMASNMVLLSSIIDIKKTRRNSSRVAM